jgi:hypothetical protein
MARETLIWVVHLLFWIAIGLIVFGMRGNRRPAKVLNSERVEFAPNWIVVWAWMLVYLRMAFFAANYLKQGLEKPWDLATGALFSIALFVVLFYFPETIAVTGEGVEQVYWLRKNKRIRWEEIVEVNSGKRDKVVTITGSDGTKIIHSRQLADRARFLQELKEHCGEKLPLDFPRESVPSL